MSSGRRVRPKRWLGSKNFSTSPRSTDLRRLLIATAWPGHSGRAVSEFLNHPLWNERDGPQNRVRRRERVPEDYALFPHNSRGPEAPRRHRRVVRGGKIKVARKTGSTYKGLVRSLREDARRSRHRDKVFSHGFDAGLVATLHVL